MNKVAKYLNEHILGEVTTEAAVLRAFSTDASVLTITPEMVTYPRVTNDIRKIARFSWQLAEKGHALPLTVRGGGSDQTGAAIGKGVIVNTTAHMNTIFELDAKQKLIRLQPGVTFKAVNDALALHGLHVPSYPVSAAYSTIGGAIANNASGVLSGRHGATGDWVHQLEVVLANGDVLQTGRISKRELGRKKGLQTFEGEIYRQIDNLITDNEDIIANKIDYNVRDNAGYGGIARVKNRDGSFDLAPLFIGSQGTLGIVSEVIMKTEERATGQVVVAAAFETYDAARDGIDALRALDPGMLEALDGELFVQARAQGKAYKFYTDAADSVSVGAIVLVAFDDGSERANRKKAKKVLKALEPLGAYVRISDSEVEAQELLVLRDVSTAVIHPDGEGMSAPPIADGAYVPFERFEDFSRAVSELAQTHHVSLPLYGHALDGIFYVRPGLQLHKVGDKQKVFKLLGDYATLVAAHGGHLIGEAAEGRIKAPFAYKQIDDDVMELYAAIKAVFDPNGILNPGVKQSVEMRELVSQLRPDYDLAGFASYSPAN
jgi:FAD/FMN-containing dehydrogenase